MMCKSDEFRNERANAAAQSVEADPYESSQSSLVERVCAFLERYAIAHDEDAGLKAAKIS